MDDAFRFITNLYRDMVNGKKLVIGYEMISIDRLHNYQVELWDLADRLLIYRHSSVFTQKTLEFLLKEQSEYAIELVEKEMSLYMKECSHIYQYLNEEELGKRTQGE